MEDIQLDNLDDIRLDDAETNPESKRNVEDEINTNEDYNTDSENNTEDSQNTTPPWWKMRSIMEIVLTQFVGCAIIVITVLAVSHLRMPQAAVENKSICMTLDCIHTASRILKNMDPEVDPCNNFYRFACGNFIRNHNIQNGESGINRFSLIKDHFTPQFRAIFEEPIKLEEPKQFVLVKNLYKACMNTSLIESRGIQPFLEIVDSFGGWPVLTGTKWNESAFDWQKSVIKFRKKGFNFNKFFKVSIGTYYINPVKHAIKIGELSNTDFGNIHESLRKGMQDRIVNAYYNYMVDIAVLLGAPREIAALEMEESLLFEINLANISTQSQEQLHANKLPDHYTIAELQIKYPIINWAEYINALLPPDLTVNDDEVISVEAYNHLKEIDEVLRNTPKRVVANYLMWKITSDNIELLTEDFRKRQVEYKTVVDGKKLREISRLEYCTGLIKDRFYNALYSLYAIKHFNADAKHIVVEMVNRTKAEVTKILRHVDWMDRDTRKQALKKAAAMTSNIGYLDEILDVSKLEDYYADVQIDENKFMESLLNMTVFFTNKDFRKLREKVKRREKWTIYKDFTKTEPFYKPFDNSINVPLGILQDVFFSADRPQYMNYGAIGFIIGHEITHGLNDQKKQEDLILFHARFPRWTSATQEAYLKKVQCINEQYGNYTVEEVNLNIKGNNTQEENIVDNGALKEAYLAYAKWVEDNKEEPQLPGVNYTPRQMFWLSAASIWCSKYTPEAMKKYIKLNKHSPPEFRVVGSFSNNKYFAKDFQCPRGSSMNPQRKCKIW